MEQTRKHTFSKEERIYLRDEVRALFASKKGLSSYPYRILLKWVVPHAPSEVPVKVLISVPKRSFKRAVDRNFIKRQFREGYRASKASIWEAVGEVRGEQQLLVGFIYIADTRMDSSKVHHAIEKALQKITVAIQPHRLESEEL